MLEGATELCARAAQSLLGVCSVLLGLLQALQAPADHHSFFLTHPNPVLAVVILTAPSELNIDLFYKIPQYSVLSLETQ